MSHPLLTAERTSQEVDFLERALNFDPGASILDIGCGFGRHAVELATRGYRVKGIDPSEAMIVEARSRAKEAGVSVDFCQERGEEIEEVDIYDAAICLFTSLGQINFQDDNSKLIEKAHSALKPGGQFIVEVPQREKAVTRLVTQEHFRSGRNVTNVYRTFDEATQIVTEEFRVTKNGEEHIYRLQYRLFDYSELERLFIEAGFLNLAAYGDYSRTSLNEEHLNMLLVGEKRC